MTRTAKVAEIFDSVQGEGPYIGYRQLFVRFCGCNLLCDYCDTEFDKGDDYTVAQLVEKIKSFKLEPLHSVSLTGGEPLLQYEFLKEFLPSLKQLGLKIYLETNGTMDRALDKVIEYIDIVSMDLNWIPVQKSVICTQNMMLFLRFAKTFKRHFCKTGF